MLSPYNVKSLLESCSLALSLDVKGDCSFFYNEKDLVLTNLWSEVCFDCSNMPCSSFTLAWLALLFEACCDSSCNTLSALLRFDLRYLWLYSLLPSIDSRLLCDDFLWDISNFISNLSCSCSCLNYSSSLSAYLFFLSLSLSSFFFFYAYSSFSNSASFFWYILFLWGFAFIVRNFISRSRFWDTPSLAPVPPGAVASSSFMI